MICFQNIVKKLLTSIKYIDFNTEKRQNADNDSEKDFFKLMINSVYGKQWKICEKESM